MDIIDFIEVPIFVPKVNVATITEINITIEGSETKAPIDFKDSLSFQMVAIKVVEANKITGSKEVKKLFKPLGNWSSESVLL